jgi:hypothetical protein
MDKIDEYSTKDLAESAVLILHKQELLRIDRNGKICWFIFSNKSKCKKLSQKFFFGELLVNARDYRETISRLKNRIFAGGKE